MVSALASSRSLARAASHRPQWAVLDFLAPSTVSIRPPWRLFNTSTSSTQAQATALPALYAQHADSTCSSEQHHHSSNAAPPSRPLTKAQRDFLDSAIRVNQAGELAAVLIYAAQTPPIVRSYPQLRPLMKHMYDQEAGHLSYFNSLIAKHRIRPTAMYPVWHAAASVLGWGTAVMGREAAMACTEAVETEIGSHYNEQVRTLLAWADRLETQGEGLSVEMQELVTELRRIRDEELEHLDHAVANDAKEARPYELLTDVIKGGCRTAIWISEKI